AEELLQRATQLKTYHPEQVYLDLGDLYLQKGEYRKAVAALRRSIRYDSRDERPYYALAKADRALGDAAGAADAQARFQRISKLHVEMQTQEARVFHNPGDARARLALARIYGGIGMVSQAEEQYAQYLRLNPSDRAADAEFRRMLAQSLAARSGSGASDFAVP